MKPTNDYVFIAVQKITESESGIIIPGEIEKEGAQTGEVIAVGPEVKNLKEGDKVVFNKHHYDLLFVEKETNREVFVGKPTSIYAVIA